VFFENELAKNGIKETAPLVVVGFFDEQDRDMEADVHHLDEGCWYTLRQANLRGGGFEESEWAGDEAMAAEAVANGFYKEDPLATDTM
jgi:hypothetical protein